MPTVAFQQPINKSRRTALKALGLLPLAGYGLTQLYQGANAASNVACTLAPKLTEGPYWVDEKLNRADLTTNTTRSSVLNGLPLTLTINVFNANGQSCGADPASNIQIDLWHCDAAGEYSDVSGNGQTNTKGQTFLRGYQVTDASGAVTFKTIYPGWYPGRTVHIHLRARAYDANGNLTYNFTSQLFFDDSITDRVFTQSPYSARGTRDTRNSNDNIYNTETPVMVTLTENSTGGYNGTVAIGLSELPSSLTNDRFSVTTANSGSSTTPTLTSTVTLPPADVGSSGSIFVAASVGANWYFNNGQNWVAHPVITDMNYPAFYTGVLASSHSLVILSGLDISGLQGTSIYVGYGQTALAMLQNSQYSKTYTL